MSLDRPASEIYDVDLGPLLLVSLAQSFLTIDDDDGSYYGRNLISSSLTVYRLITITPPTSSWSVIFLRNLHFLSSPIPISSMAS